MTATDAIDVGSAVPRLRTLANPARLRIVLRLLEGEQSVAAIETSLGLRQPNLSQHLGDLREAGIVAARRESRTVFYSLADAAARHLVAAIAHGFGAPPRTEPAQAAASEPPTRQSIQAAVFATIEGNGP